MRHLYANRSRALGLPRLGRAPAHEFYRGPSSSSSLAGSRARLSRHREAVGARLPLPRTTVAWSSRVKNPAFRSIRCSCTSAPRPTGSQIHGRNVRIRDTFLIFIKVTCLFVVARGVCSPNLSEFVGSSCSLDIWKELSLLPVPSQCNPLVVSLYIAR